MQFDCINFHYDICKVVLQLLAYDTYSKLIMMMMMNNDKNNPAVLPWNLQACCHPRAALCQTILDLVAAGDDAGGTGDKPELVKACRAPVKSPSSVYRHSVYYKPDSVCATQANSTFHPFVVDK